MNRDDLIVLDGFDVVAVPDQGVWVVDDEGNCWHVGGPHNGDYEGNKLAQAYHEAVRQHSS